MKFFDGEVIECPACLGSKFEGNKKIPCRSCRGEGKMEAARSDSQVRAPAGTWFPTTRKGKTGFLICLFGPDKEETIR